MVWVRRAAEAEVETAETAGALGVESTVSRGSTEAKAIYLAHKGEALNGKKWEELIFEDFDKLRKAGITSPLMDEVEFKPAATSAARATCSTAPSCCLSLAVSDRISRRQTVA